MFLLRSRTSHILSTSTTCSGGIARIKLGYMLGPYITPQSTWNVIRCRLAYSAAQRKIKRFSFTPRPAILSPFLIAFNAHYAKQYAIVLHEAWESSLFFCCCCCCMLAQRRRIVIFLCPYEVLIGPIVGVTSLDCSPSPLPHQRQKGRGFSVAGRTRTVAELPTWMFVNKIFRGCVDPTLVICALVWQEGRGLQPSINFPYLPLDSWLYLIFP